MLEDKTELWYWFSPHWFSPDTLRNFEWDNIFYLYFIPIIPLVFFLRWLLHVRFRQKLDIALPNENINKRNFTALLRFFPLLLFHIFLALVLVSLARPQMVSEKVEYWTEGIDIILTMDISESMELEDFKPNRLEASKKVAKEFIQARKNDKIGIVIFAGNAFSYVPLTTDYDLLRSSLNDINFNMISEEGTAIGNAIITSVNRLRETQSKSKVIILLSDGESTAGNMDPLMAAKLAYAYNIKIYSIGIGSEGKIPYGKDPSGNSQYVVSTLNESTLRNVAEIGKGKFFRASNSNRLQGIFELINNYEKGENKETRFKDNRDHYHPYLIWAIIFFLLWLFTKNTFLSNALED